MKKMKFIRNKDACQVKDTKRSVLSYLQQSSIKLGSRLK